MTCENTSYYLVASSRQFGAIGIFHVYGDDTALADALDLRLGGRKELGHPNTLADGELRYGWLRDASGDIIDEVMLARPVSGMRVLMTHGGHVIREKIIEIFTARGIPALETLSDLEAADIVHRDAVCDSLLAGCVTQAQAAAVLEAREAAAGSGASPLPPANLLLTHRLLLAGPPNAGKSSLLNNLAEHERAFVHHEAGATTDVVDELVDLGGYAVLVGDMPGFSFEADGLGRAAWGRAVSRLGLADAVLFVCDASRGWDEATRAACREVAAALDASAASRAGFPRLAVVLNKSDLPSAIVGEPWREHFPDARVVAVCSLPDGDAAAALGGLAAWLFGE